MRAVGHRWRDYRTAAGARPVRDFIRSRRAEDRIAIYAAMVEVTRDGLTAARHLRGDIYEVRADGQDESYRLLFAPGGRKGRILLALNAFSKRTQRTPAYIIPDIGQGGSHGCAPFET